MSWPCGQYTISGFRLPLTGISYDYLNDEHLSNVTGNGATYQLQYDAFGRTVSRTLNGATTYFYYQGENAFQETGAVLATNQFGLGTDEIVCRLPSTGQTYLYFPDHEGSITHVTNLGAMAEKYRYDVFGQPKIMDAAGNARTLSVIGNRFMFTGREWAPANFGFYEYRARAYHPGLGRFMSEDPKGFDTGDYNPFRYCGNDPVDRVDPMGLEKLKSTDYADLQLKGGPLEKQTDPIQEFIRLQNGYKPDASTIERYAIKATHSAEDRTWNDAFHHTLSGYAQGIYVGPQGDVAEGPLVKSEVLKGSNQTQYREWLDTRLKGGYRLAAVGHSHPSGVHRGQGDWDLAATMGAAIFKARGDGHPERTIGGHHEDKVYSSIDVLVILGGRRPGLMFNINNEGRITGGDSAREPVWPYENGGY